MNPILVIVEQIAENIKKQLKDDIIMLYEEELLPITSKRLSGGDEGEIAEDIDCIWQYVEHEVKGKDIINLLEEKETDYILCMINPIKDITYRKNNDKMIFMCLGGLQIHYRWFNVINEEEERKIRNITIRCDIASKSSKATCISIHVMDDGRKSIIVLEGKDYYRLCCSSPSTASTASTASTTCHPSHHLGGGGGGGSENHNKIIKRTYGDGKFVKMYDKYECNMGLGLDLFGGYNVTIGAREDNFHIVVSNKYEKKIINWDASKTHTKIRTYDGGHINTKDLIIH